LYLLVSSPCRPSAFSSHTPQEPAKISYVLRPSSSASVLRKVDAERFLLGVEDAKLRGAYVDPAAGKVNFGEWAERWYKTTAGLKPSTRHTYRQLLDYQVLPTFEGATLAGVDMLLVREWLAALVEADLSPSRIRNAHQVLSQVLATAVEANRLARNPAKGVWLPRIVRREMHFLTAAQVEQLAAAITVPFPLLVRFDAYTGRRAGCPPGWSLGPAPRNL
jgi:hypothetical protein